MTQKKRIALAVISCLLILAFAISGTALYLTDNDSKTNTVTVGDVKVELLEPHWEDANNVVPNQELPKDPQIRNTGINDAIVYMTVEVPVEDITLAADNGTKGTKGKTELFWFKDSADGASTHANNFDTNWVHLETKDIGADLTGSTRTYVFAYKTTLGANETTTPLFDKIQVKNFIENEIPGGKSEQININIYGIQASDVLEENVDLSDNLTNANLAKIYDIYINQNGQGSSGGDSPAQPTTQDTVEHENVTYNVENADVQTFMATPAYDSSDYSYTNMVDSSAFTVSRPDRPATATISVPDGATTITITDSTSGKVINDTLSGNTYTLENYTPGQVLNYVMKDSSNNAVKDGTITVEGQVRMINGESNTFNIRDIGGWTADGGTLKYGKVYRGSRAETSVGGEASEATKKVLKDDLGIKTEVDFRDASEGGARATSALGNDVQYVSCHTYKMFKDLVEISNDTSTIKTAIQAAFDSVKNEQPIYVHCHYGAERTGTCIFILESLLGVSECDLDRDYELTTCSQQNSRYRTDNVYKELKEYFNGFGQGNIRDNVAKWATKIGISLSDINEFRSKMINGTPETLVVEDSAWSQNLFDSSKVTLASRLKSDGTIVSADTNLLVTDFIPVNQFAEIEIKSDTNTDFSGSFYQYCIYDMNKNIIGAYSIRTERDTNDTWYRVDFSQQSYGAPSYIRATIRYADINNIEIRTR